MLAPEDGAQVQALGDGEKLQALEEGAQVQAIGDCELLHVLDGSELVLAPDSHRPLMMGSRRRASKTAGG